MKKYLAAMDQSMHQMFHEQYLKHKDNLPADYESTITSMMDDMFQNMPMDEMMQAMVPAYQEQPHQGRHRQSGCILFHAHRGKIIA